MTDEEIDALESVAHLDALVDWTIFHSWKEPLTMQEEDIAQRHEMLPHYSTNIGDAWRIVERLWDKHLLYFSLSFEESLYFVYFSDGNNLYRAGGTNAPIAICKASLKALNHVQNLSSQSSH